jgi:murein DD-endopeptidase MepM/ murein hydrolase activator NlpD
VRTTLLVALVFLLAVAACGDDGDVAPAVAVKVNTPLVGATPRDPTPDPSIQIEPPELVLSGTEVYQGGALLVSVVGSVEAGSITLFGMKHDLIQGARSKFSFAGVGVEQEPGAYTLDVAFTLTNGTTGALHEEIRVLATGWTVDALTFNPGQEQRFLDAQVISDEESQLRAVYSTDSGTKLWEGPWSLPIDGPLTAHFGEQRSINGGEPTGHHGGTDFGAEPGTPVGATNHGVVVMARQMALRGNFVVIDHGGGVLSGYGHLSQFSVAEGQVVEPGDVIGLVGSTGLSTGAHLHWEMAVDGVLVDALRFFDGSNGF